MARQKKLSTIIEKAIQRHTALSSINPPLDLGGDLTLAAFNTEINTARQALNDYNNLLSQVDAAYNLHLETEVSVREFSKRMLAGVASRYGMDSDEYEQAGGTRDSERKRPVRKKAAV